MRPVWAATGSSWSLLLILQACGGGPDSNYTLDFTPVLAENQAPFDDVVSMDLVLRDGTTEIARYALDGVAAGASPDVGKLPPLSDTIVSIEGLDQSGNVVAVGYSSPLTLTDGEKSYDMLITETEAFAWLGGTGDDPIWAMAGAADGRGNFFLFGGITDRFYGGVSDLVLRLEIAPAGTLKFEAVATLPTHSTLSTGARSHSTATLLTGSHTDAGKILVVGGWDELGSFAAVTYQSLLFDPETLTFEEIDDSDAIIYSRAEHGAIALGSGDVVIYGGSTLSQNGHIEFYDAEERRFFVTEGSPEHDAWLASGAPMGTNGALVCGGVELDLNASTYGAATSIDSCYSVDVAGNDQRVLDLRPRFERLGVHRDHGRSARGTLGDRVA